MSCPNAPLRLKRPIHKAGLTTGWMDVNGTGSQVISKPMMLRSLSLQPLPTHPASPRHKASFVSSLVGFLMLATLEILCGAGNATSQRPALSVGISTPPSQGAEVTPVAATRSCTCATSLRKLAQAARPVTQRSEAWDADCTQSQLKSSRAGCSRKPRVASSQCHALETF